MRTKIDRLSKTCPECGTRNRLHIFTTGYSPTWRIACSNCIAVIINPRTRRSSWSLGSPSDPIADVVVLPSEASARRVRRPGLLRRRRATGLLSESAHGHQKKMSHRYAAAGFLAGCSLAFALLLGGPMLVGTGQDEITADGGSGRDVIASAMPAPERAAAPEESSAAEWAEAPLIAGKAGQDDLPLPMPSLRASLDGTPYIPRNPREVSLVAHAASDRAAGIHIPRESMAQLQHSVFQDPVAASASEAALDLSRAERRSIQRRLVLAKHDTKGIDGIFGSATRAAILAWQNEAGLAATGFATRPTLERLAAETDAAYRAWQQAENARRQKDQRLASAVPVPRPAPDAASSCQRLANGEIAYGQSFGCDVKGLGENLKSIRRTFAQTFDSSRETRLRSRNPGDA